MSGNLHEIILIPVRIPELDHFYFFCQFLGDVLVACVGFVERLNLRHQVLVYPRKVGMCNFQGKRRIRWLKRSAKHSSDVF